MANETPAENQQIANTIKGQIGVWPLAEVGARQFLFGSRSLFFDAKPLTRIVTVQVELTSDDLYDVTIRNKKSGEVLAETKGIFNDQLAATIRNLGKALA